MSAPQGGGEYDLVVIGAGSAGFSAAITAADAGRRVALLGHGVIGGTCVNTGCVPSKALIHAAAAVHAGAGAARFAGVSPCGHGVDWQGLMAGKDALVTALRQRKYTDLLPRYPGIDYFHGAPARLIDGGAEFGGRRIEAARTLIATGSRSALPDIGGIGAVGALDAAALMELDEKPRSLTFVGGGFIGVELAQMMARLGVGVTLLCRSRLLPQAEPEVSGALARALRDEGITLHCGVRYGKCRETAQGVALGFERNGARDEVTSARLVVTAGRRANTAGLGLGALGVATDGTGAVMVGADMQTSRAGIFAAGDVTDRDRFVYMAAYGARVAVTNALGLGRLRYDNSAMPWVVFSDPQVAGVGLGEAQARAAGHDTVTSVLGLDNVPRALAARDTRGLIKLVAERDGGRLLGGQIIADGAGEAIQTLALAIGAGMDAAALGATLFPYLTLVEGLKLAAQGFARDVDNLSCCAG